MQSIRRQHNKRLGPSEKLPQEEGVHLRSESGSPVTQGGVPFPQRERSQERAQEEGS